MTTAPIAKAFDQSGLARVVDMLAVAIAITLPWSTSATSVLIAIWFLALIPTFVLQSPADRAREFHTFLTAAGGLPIALWLLGIIGLLWTNTSYIEGFHGLRGMHKLLLIPFVLIQFQRSDRGMAVLVGFLASSMAMLIVSWAAWSATPRGIVFKDQAVQSGEFMICAFALAHLSLDAWQNKRHGRAIALAALAGACLLNLAVVLSSKTSLVTFFILLAVVGAQRLSWKGTIAVLCGGVIFAVVAWQTSPYLRLRISEAFEQVTLYETENVESSVGYRLEFWKKSIAFFLDAPVFGHGTASTDELFRRAATGDHGASSAITGNPHSITMEIAVQFGLIGLALLYAMWIAHLMLFRGTGLASWLGLGLVVQDVVSSQTFSYLFDFTTGWTYVFGVGVLGGMVLRQSRGAGTHSDGMPPSRDLRD